jgi:hypothetical protein
MREFINLSFKLTVIIREAMGKTHLIAFKSEGIGECESGVIERRC